MVVVSNRRDPLSLQQQADIGRLTRAMRAAGMLWKEIAGELGLCERHLRRCAGMSANNAGMSDHEDCRAA